MSFPQKQKIKTTLLQIFDKIQSPLTEKVGFNTYISLLHQIIYNETDKVCDEYLTFILKQVSFYLQSPHQKNGFKLLCFFFLAYNDTISFSHLKYTELILDLLQFHINKQNFNEVVGCFEDIVKFINLHSDDNASISLFNNFLYRYSIENENHLYGMTCLKKVIENSNIINIENYYDDIIQKVVLEGYKSSNVEDNTRNEILNCLIRIILLKEGEFIHYAKDVFDLVKSDILKVSVQKKVLNVIYLLTLYCTEEISPFERQFHMNLKSLKSARDKKVRENAVLVLQIYNEHVLKNNSENSHNLKMLKLKKSNSQEEIILNTKNDDLNISRSYNVNKKNSFRNSLGRSYSFSNFFYKKDKGVDFNFSLKDKNGSLLTSRSNFNNSLSLGSTRSSSHSLFKLQKGAKEKINNNNSIICSNKDILNLSSISVVAGGGFNMKEVKEIKDNADKLTELNTMIGEFTSKFDKMMNALNKMKVDNQEKFSEVNTNVNRLEEKINNVLEEMDNYTFPSSIHQMIPIHKCLEDKIIIALNEGDDIEILDLISKMGIEDIKKVKSDLIEEVIIKGLSFLMRGQNVIPVVSFVQLCLIAIKPILKTSTLNTIKDIFYYTLQNKNNELSDKEYVDINTILKLAQ